MVSALELLPDIFRPERGGRTNAPDLAVLVSSATADRRLDELETMQAAARAAHLRYFLVRVAHGQPFNVAAANRAQVLGTEIIRLENFRDLAPAVDDVMERVCHEKGDHTCYPKRYDLTAKTSLANEVHILVGNKFIHAVNLLP